MDKDWKPRSEIVDAVVDGLKQREGDQPLPRPGAEVCVQDLVLADIEARKQVGVQRYGTTLQPFNGRDVLRDAYEEALDLAVYLRQAIYERDNPAVRHAISFELSSKPDAGGLLVAVCSCGRYRSAPGLWTEVGRRGVAHLNTMDVERRESGPPRPTAYPDRFSCRHPGCPGRHIYPHEVCC